MDLQPIGDMVAMVVHLHTAGAGAWQLQVEGLHPLEAPGSQPLALTVRLWYSGDGQIVRGMLQLRGSDRYALIQGNADLLELVRTLMEEHPRDGSRHDTRD